MTARPGSELAQRAGDRRRKDLATAINIEMQKLPGSQAACKSEGEDAAGRGAGDKIKASGNGSPSEMPLFEFGQNAGREDAAYAASIQR